MYSPTSSVSSGSAPMTIPRPFFTLPEFSSCQVLPFESPPSPETWTYPITIPSPYCAEGCCQLNMTSTSEAIHFVQKEEWMNPYFRGLGNSMYDPYYFRNPVQSAYLPFQPFGNFFYPTQLEFHSGYSNPYLYGGWPVSGKFFHRKKGKPSTPSRRHLLSFSERKGVCGFCKSSRESKEVYKSHQLKNANGVVMCPILRSKVCPLCHQTGDLAHTISYCQLYPFLSEGMLV